jgi:dUTP pyrophosphatase
MKVKFKKLNENAKAPYQGTAGSAGFDLYATSKQRIDLYHTKFGTGLAVEIPEGYVGLVFPRSSCYKQGMLLSNCVGVIDSDYRGEITAVFIGTDAEYCYNVGDRICQLVIMPYPQVEFVEAAELSETARGAGGYGSTGK